MKVRETQRLGSLVVDLSLSLKKANVKVVLTEDDAAVATRALSFENNQEDTEKIVSRPVIHMGKILCYIVCDSNEVKKSRAVINCRVYNENHILVYDECTFDMEERQIRLDTYKNVIEYAERFMQESEADKKADIKTLSLLSSKEACDIDFYPYSDWFTKACNNNIGILKAKAYELATNGEFNDVCVKGEYNELFRETHKRFCIMVVSNKPLDLGYKFTKLEIKDVLKWRELMNIKDYVSGYVYLAANVDADYVREIRFLKGDFKRYDCAMDYIRDDRYRRAGLKSSKRSVDGGFRCAYCGITYGDSKDIEIDHIIPVNAVKGRNGIAYKKYMEKHGWEKGVNSEENLTTSCHICNKKKGKKTGLWITLGFLGKTSWFHPLLKTLFYGVVLVLLFLAVLNTKTYPYLSVKENIGKNIAGYIAPMALIIGRIAFIIERKIRNAAYCRAKGSYSNVIRLCTYTFTSILLIALTIHTITESSSLLEGLLVSGLFYWLPAITFIDTIFKLNIENPRDRERAIIWIVLYVIMVFVLELIAILTLSDVISLFIGGEMALIIAIVSFILLNIYKVKTGLIE